MSIVDAPSPGMSWDCALLLKQRSCMDNGPRYSKWRSTWVEYVGTHWNFVEQEDVRNWAYNETSNWVYTHNQAAHKWAPNKVKITNLLDAFASVVVMDSRLEDGDWMEESHEGEKFIPMKNGLLNIKTREMIPSTPLFFTTWSLPYDYDTSERQPIEWLKFLTSTLPDQSEDIDTLQEWLGYLVSGRTDMQKAMLLKGRKRSGKGTILGICEALVGRENSVSTSFENLGETFGLEPLIGKSLITIGDSQMDRPNKTAIERIKSISGCDTVGVNRKYKKELSVRLPGRLTVGTNLGVNLLDTSGAAASRFITVLFQNSFIGREDLHLSTRLNQELPQIMKWALVGLDRLSRNGRFTESIDAKQEQEEMAEEGSPITLFLNESCEIITDGVVARDVLFAAYKIWTKETHQGTMNQSNFGRHLKACDVKITKYRPLIDGKQIWFYRGIRLTEERRADLRYADVSESTRKLIDRTIVQ